MNLLVLNEIKNGKSECNGTWIKHSTLDDEARLEALTAKFLALAVKRKILTEKEAILLADERGTWTNKDQVELASNLTYLSRLRESYNKVIEAQKKYLYDDLVSASNKIERLKFRRAEAIGRTAEEWANKIATEKYILSMFYKDPSLSIPVWSVEEAEELEQGEVDAAFVDFFDYKQKVAPEVVKEIACSNYCQNLYSVAGNPFYFFGKHALDLTSDQQRLLFHLENYKNIIGNVAGKVPNSVLTDWKELEKWANSNEKSREEMERNWGSNGNSDKINFENIKKASLVQGGEDKKTMIELVS